jgi:hypothetical protein
MIDYQPTADGELRQKTVGCFFVDVARRAVNHTALLARFRIEDGDDLTVLDYGIAPPEWHALIATAAAEALQQERGRDPRVVGQFTRFE